MKGASLKSRAIVFALCAGAIAFVLALFATAHGSIHEAAATHALTAAIICAMMCWAAADRAVAATRSAINAAVGRLTRAAHGDLVGAIPEELERDIPALADAMRTLFRQIGSNLDSVQRLAMFDPVTALPNRTNFRQTCERMLPAIAPGTVSALLFIDLDRFKSVNDTMGHAMGDMLLGLVAKRLRAVVDRVTAERDLRPPLLGRLAGDEFTIFFPEIESIEHASQVGRGILLALGEPFDVIGQQIEIGASIGISMRPEHGTTLTQLMRAADAAMYHAKASGRGRAEQFSDALASEIAERIRLETDLREAIDQDQFALVFQPQVSVAGGQIVAAEALLRWWHPVDGVKLPGTFLRRAEETGLIVEIGEWVIATIAATIARWERMGIEQRLAINISQRQLDHASFFRRLREAMHLAKAPARLLELEITETMAMQCSGEVISAIAALRADGATIAIDDFGTGYSNLARLRDLPIDRVKLDRSLIEHIADRAETRMIAQAMIGLIHGLGCEAVAEGIETHAQANVLRVIGCDVIQGYAIAEPMDEQAFIHWSKQEIRRLAIG